MQEYVDNPEETASVLDENGWFKTGDMATFDEYGNFFIVDRIKEMFRYRGLEVKNCTVVFRFLRFKIGEHGRKTFARVVKPIVSCPGAFRHFACYSFGQDISDLIREDLQRS